MSVDTGSSGRRVVGELVSSGALGEVFAKVDSGEVELTGSDGLLAMLFKEALRAGVASGVDGSSGVRKGEPTPTARGKARNGTSVKTIDSQVGSFEIEVPRDRAGTFTPRLVRKGQRRTDGLDAMIISLYAGGMTAGEIRHHLELTLGVEVSAGTISNITDAVADAFVEWQSAPRRVLSDHLSGRDRREDPLGRACVQPGGPSGGRGRHGRGQARPGNLDPIR